MKKEPVDIHLCCPCERKSALDFGSYEISCKNESCPHHKERPFNYIDGQPILVSDILNDTLVDPCNVATKVARRRFKKRALSISEKIFSSVSQENALQLLELIADGQPKKILIIGGGEKGAGVDLLEKNSLLTCISCDIYASENTNFVADAHYIPVSGDSIDVVWIQAVLEHVLEPSVVVAEIHRVLKLGGICYAETPFMQQVHEAGYDYQRFTLLGHRYLFRDFELIDHGQTRGAGEALAWSLKSFIWSLTRSKLLARILGKFFSIILRQFDPLMSDRAKFDNSSGVYFIGKKKDVNDRLRHKDVPGLYGGLQ